MCVESFVGSFTPLDACNIVFWASHACVFVIVLMLDEEHVMEWDGMGRDTLFQQKISGEMGSNRTMIAVNN